MIDFNLSDTEQMISETARSFFESFADNAHLVEVEKSVFGYDEARWKSFVELGWNGLALPATAGGGAGSITELGVLLFEFGRAAYPSPFLQSVGSVGVVVDRLGDGAGADQLRSSLVSGSKAALLSTIGSTGRFAEVSGDGYVLRGSPIALEFAHVAEILVGLLPVAGRDTWVLFAVDLHSDRIGVEMCASADNERIGVVDFDGVVLTTADLLAEEIEGSRAAEALARVRLMRAAEMAGGAGKVLDMTAAYMRERQQFGVPLGSFQAVQHHLANMRTDVDAARLVVFEGLTLAASGRDIEAPAAIASFVAGRSYAQTVLTGAQLHGGIGITIEYALHHYFRRAKTMQVRLGTQAAQLGRIVDTRLLRPTTGLW